MGWHNPPIPWHELHRRMSGAPVHKKLQGDGGDAPGWTRRRGAYQKAPQVNLIHRGRAPRYAELHAHSSFSHLDGASTPEQFVEAALALGLSGLAITDHDGMYGLPRFAWAAEDRLPTVLGAELSLDHDVPATSSERAIGARSANPDP